MAFAEAQFSTPRDDGLGLSSIGNAAGLSIAALPNGAIFAIRHRDASGETMINQVLGSPLAGGIGRLYLRGEGRDPVEIVGPSAEVRFGAGSSSFIWEGESGGVRHRVRLAPDPEKPAWFWKVELENGGDAAIDCDLVLVQDVGLGGCGFLMGSEAYASQYLDHAIVDELGFGPVVLSRQNLSQGGRHPWLAQGCLHGAKSYATDARQWFGTAYRADGRIQAGFGIDLPGERLQHEVACPALQSRPIALAPGGVATVTFFALFAADHPEASGDADLARLADLPARATAIADEAVATALPDRSLLQAAPALPGLDLDEAAIGHLYPDRLAAERIDGALASFFVADGEHNRHVVLAAKERRIVRRHGAILRSGQGTLPDDSTLSSTAWMHGVFAAQLTIGNTSFHKLFSVSRDPYGITRASGLRILADTGDGWRLLTVPSAFEIGLSDCRWVYRLADRTIRVRAIAAGDSAALQIAITVDGPPCRFLVAGHVVLGEREYEQSGTVTVGDKRLTFRPGKDWLWGQQRPEATMTLVTSTPDTVEAVGGDELLFSDGRRRSGSHVALRSKPTQRLVFTVSGSMTDAAEAERLAERLSRDSHSDGLLAPARAYWNHVLREARIEGDSPDVEGHRLMLPWLAHDAIVHLSVPHGLEQYSGAAWGTRDVCQGPVELLLALRHDGVVRDILKLVFAEQDRDDGDWPQWFMLAPYGFIRAGDSHGDVILWPLKALCDYIETTGDLPILNETVGWRRKGQLVDGADTIGRHVETLLAAVRGRFIPGTSLIRYGEGDWNDSLQPVDPHLRDWLVSSWTAGLAHEQFVRYAAILGRAGRKAESKRLADEAAAIRADFNRHLVRDGIVAGYGLFDPAHDGVELLLHPSDRRTGLHYSLIAITQAILGGLIDDPSIRDHLKLIEERLTFPDGVRLIDKPVTYHGGIETLFRRAESSSFFGREIGLMYVHAHLRHCEALVKAGRADEAVRALALVNPVLTAGKVATATPRQRNSYFSSSDAAFADRYRAQSDWAKATRGSIGFDGGWRIYSSGPGIFTRFLLVHLFGLGRRFGEESGRPLAAAGLASAAMSIEVDGRRIGRDRS